MPCLRGIEVSLTAQLDGVQILEYPHPEGASVKLLDNQANGSHGFPPTRDAKCGSPGYQKTKPTVSVYIPSAPGKSSVDDRQSFASLLAKWKRN